MNVLKLLFNPVFLLAAGLHAGLLMIPVAGGSPDEIVPAPDPEGESITVTRIPPNTQPAKPGVPTTAPRPASATAVRQAAVNPQRQQRQQQGQQRRPQTSQNSSDRTASSDNRRQANNQSNRRVNRDSDNEVAVLPANNNSPNNTSGNSSGNTPARTQAEQTAPTLVALKDGAQTQEVPKPLQNFLARLRHSILKTTDPEVEEAKQAWLVSLSEQPEIRASDPQGLDKAVEINYPLIADDDGPRRFLSCLTPAPEKGLAGVVVNPDGTIAAEPTILRSSGYGFLNDIALEKLKDYQDFPDEDTQKLYTIDIEVDYDKDACISLSDLQK
ncbi:MAG: hypothetical protein AAGI69_19655 [Cyanobacteria bacterium P01_H01_bin.21]